MQNQQQPAAIIPTQNAAVDHNTVAGRFERAKTFSVGTRPDFGSKGEGMLELAMTFPTLAKTDLRHWKDGDFEFHKFERFILNEPSITGGGHWAGMFVLSVWVANCSFGVDRRDCEYCGKIPVRSRVAFDVQKALCIWDDEHRAAFLAWAADPWTP